MGSGQAEEEGPRHDRVPPRTCGRRAQPAREEPVGVPGEATLVPEKEWKRPGGRRRRRGDLQAGESARPE
uniref:Uncharacterized protein n=1 Tax=Sphaerodactylus townsendi TaxID=933632 RepID=A0ACB8FB78_9SAUR